MPAFKPAYLIHGDDHGRLGERRARLRSMAEAESGSSGVELFEGDACTAENLVNALSAMTFALGRRFIIADGVERWREPDIEIVAAALRELDPESVTVCFFAHEEARRAAPKALHAAVAEVGGVIDSEMVLKARELPRWVGGRAAELGLELDVTAARALIAQVGDRQQRLSRELEKLALELGPGTVVGVEEITASCASSSERKLWTLADALVAGDRTTATRALLELRQQGERIPGLLYGIVRRLRDAQEIAVALAAGDPPAAVRKRLRMPSFAADRLIADVRRRDPDAYRLALELMADLEMETRGGGGAASSEDTAAVRAVIAISG